jgi:hypothetical protein
MWLEDLMILLLIASGVFFVGVPVVKFIKQITPHKRNPLAEAKERLELARLEAEAARVNKEAEKLYGEMYQEALEDEEQVQQQEKSK